MKHFIYIVLFLFIYSFVNAQITPVDGVLIPAESGDTLGKISLRDIRTTAIDALEAKDTITTLADTAFQTPIEGQLSWALDVNQFWVYNGVWWEQLATENTTITNTIEATENPAFSLFRKKQLANEKINVVGFGDSKTLGVTGNMISSYLRTNFGNGGIGYSAPGTTPAAGLWFSYPTNYQLLNLSGHGLKSLSGHALQIDTVGNEYRIYSAKINGITEDSLTYFDAVDYWVLEQPNGGEIEILLDNVPYDTIDTNSGSTQKVKYTITTTWGSHDVKFRCLSFRGAGIVITDLNFKRSNNYGVVFHKIANGGSQVNNFNTLLGDAENTAVLSELDPDQLLVRFGTNEMSSNMLPATFKNEIIELTDTIKNYNDTLSIALCGLEFVNLTGKTYTQAEYSNEMLELAQDSSYGYINLLSLVPSWDDFDKLGYATDNVHENTEGGKVIGSFIYRHFTSDFDNFSASSTSSSGVDDSLAVHTDSITNLHLRIIDLEVADITDTDQSSTNEIQDLSLSGTELILTSDGTNTDLSSFTTDAEAAATYEPIITKNTGFNLDLGTTSGTVAEGNHTHTASQVTDFDTEVSNNASVVANTAKVSADGSVTSHSDVTDAGSGIIISTAERTAIGTNTTNNSGSVTVHSDVSDAGSGAIITTAERAAISSNTANLTQDDLSNNTTSDLSEGTNLYYTEARVSANTDVAANTASRHAAVTLGTVENNLVTLTGQQLDVVTPTLAQTLGKGASAGNIRISDVGTPLLTTDATTKAYVDAQDLAGETEVLDSISAHNDRISDLEDIDHVAATINATNNNQGRFTITGQEFGLTTNTLQEIYSAGTLLTQNNTLSSGAFNWTISANNSNFLSVTPSSVSMSSINAGNGASITTSNTGGILLDFENEGLSIDNNYGTDGQIIISKGNNANPEYINRTEKYTAVTGITTTIGTVTQIQQKEIEDNGTVTGYVKFIYDNQGNNGETTIKIPNLTSQDFTTQNDVMYSGLAAVTSIFTAVAPFINGYERTLDLTNDQIEITFDPTGTTPQYLFEFSYTYEK